MMCHHRAQIHGWRGVSSDFCTGWWGFQSRDCQGAIPVAYACGSESNSWTCTRWLIWN